MPSAPAAKSCDGAIVGSCDEGKETGAGRRQGVGGKRTGVYPSPGSIPYHLPPATSRLAVVRIPEAVNRKPKAVSQREAGSRLTAHGSRLTPI
jgi:hypothetical protein